MESVLMTAILGVIILGLIYWLVTRNLNYWEKKGVPYIKSPPIIGVMKDVVLMKKSIGEIFIDIYEKLEGEKFGGFFQCITPTLVIRDPELINRVLINDFTHFENRSPPIKKASDLFSLGVGNLSGDEWRNVRHKLTPTFTSGKLKMMFEPIKECSDEVVNYIAMKEDQDIEATDVMLRYILNVIGDVAFGLKVNTLDENNAQGNEFYKYATIFFKPSVALTIKTILFLSIPQLRSRVKLIDKGVENFFQKLTNDVIKYRVDSNTKRNDFLHLMLDIQKREKDCIKNDSIAKSCDGNDVVESEDKELLDQLKNAPLSKNDSKSEIFTEEFIAAQTFLFISGGSETTASAITFVLYELAMNQYIQKKVQDEISDVLSTQELDYQAVKKMIYLEQCIHESMRLHPVVGALLRVCSRDYVIPDTDILIEKGTTVNIPVGGLHKDPQYFPDPEKFNPDRFKDMEAIPKGVYFPFGSGPRICIAMRLAMLEIKIILVTLLMNYSVTISERMELPLSLDKASFLPRAATGMWLKFKKRKS